MSAQYTGKFKQRHIYLARPAARYLGRPGAHKLLGSRCLGRSQVSVSCLVFTLRVPSRSDPRKEKPTWGGRMRGTRGDPAHTRCLVLGGLGAHGALFRTRAVLFWSYLRQIYAKGNLESTNMIPRRASRKCTQLALFFRDLAGGRFFGCTERTRACTHPT